MTKHLLIAIMILSIVFLFACAASNPGAADEPTSDSTVPSTTAPMQETEPSVTDPSQETEPGATTPSLPVVVDPYLWDFSVFGGINEFLTFYADREDSLINPEYVSTLIRPDVISNPSYQLTSICYNRISAELIEFSGAEEFVIYYHYCTGDGCRFHKDNGSYHQYGEVQLLIWQNPDEYAGHPEEGRKLGQLVDETLQVYCKDSSETAMYTCYHTPGYLFQFRVDRDIDGFDSVVEDVMRYFAEIAPC